MFRLKKFMAGGLVASFLPLFFCGGCAMANHEEDKAQSFKWVQVGSNERGCAMFTKQANSPAVAVDAAIWYRDADGNFVLDANSCVSVTKGVSSDEK